jgi:serine/threonine protein kinase, bacterial
VDRAGDANNVYLADANSRVLKLPAGSTTQVALPFTGVKDPQGVAVDTAGNVYITDMHNNYITDMHNNRVLKLPAA